MSARTTHLLLIAGVLALAVAIIAIVRMTEARAAAAARQHELERARVVLADLARAPSGALASAPTSNDPQITRRLRAAAASAGVAEAFSSVEPGQPTRLRDTDFVETPVFIRIDPATLRQLATMLTNLCAGDRSIQVKSIELGPPPAANAAAASVEETWTADLTVNYLIHSPRR